MDTNRHKSKLLLSSVLCPLISLALASSAFAAPGGGKGKPTPTPTPAPTPIDGQTNWNGTTSSDFNTGANWTPTGVTPGSAPPVAGDVAWLTSTPTNKTINLSSNSGGLGSLAGFYFNGTGASGYNITSSSTSIKFTLTGTSNAVGTAPSEVSDATANAIRAENTSGTNTIDAPIVLGAALNSTQTFYQARGGTLVLNGIISSTNAGVGIALVSSGAANSATFVLSGANTYSGTTFWGTPGSGVAAGILSLGSSSIGGPGTISSGPLGTGTFTIQNNSNTTANNFIQSSDSTTRTISNAITFGTGATSFNVGGTGDLIFDGTLALGAGSRIFAINNTNTTFSGIISSSNSAGSLTKTGTGTMILTNANTYTGTTTINGGTLALDNNGTTTPRLTATSSIAVNSGGTLLLTSSSGSSSDRINNAAGISVNGGGTLRLNGVSEGTTGAAGFGVGALTLSGAAASVATIDFAGTSGILNFNGFAQTTSGSILNITNWGGSLAGGGAEQLLFVGTASSFQSTFSQSEIQWDGVAGYNIVDHINWFEITPVPEPSTYAAAALALAALCYNQRRRFKRLLARA